MAKPQLTTALLIEEARRFADLESLHSEPSLYGVTDGKAVGTYLEKKFSQYVSLKFDYDIGNSASGIDFPNLGIDIKVTSVKQPQSSCPFKSAKQKVYGLGYDLLIFVYDKSDDHNTTSSRLEILHAIFVGRTRTADFQTTRGILDILQRNGNEDDLQAYFMERNLPLDDVGMSTLASEVFSNPPILGYLTISNALQWRLQYKRVIAEAGSVPEITRVK